MSRHAVVLAALVLAGAVGPEVFAQTTAPATDVVTLKAPSKTGGLPVMEALALRASVREWGAAPLAPQDLSDLLWAANGVNRPDGKRTAASATNAQDVDVYVLDASGAYLYDAPAHALRRVASGDRRAEVVGPPPTTPQAGPPVQLFLVSDLSKFRVGAPELRSEWAAIDGGLVAQNVMIFCAGRALATRPRATFDREALTRVLGLTPSQHPLLNLPVGYPVK